MKRKLHAKAAKRAKLDPDTAQTALDVQQNGVLRVEDEGAEGLGAPQETSESKLAEDQAPHQQRKALRLNSTGKLSTSQHPLLVIAFYCFLSPKL